MRTKNTLRGVKYMRVKNLLIIVFLVLIITIPIAYCHVYAYSFHTYSLNYNPTAIAIDKNGNTVLGSRKHKTILIINSVNRRITAYNTEHRVFGLFIGKNNTIWTSDFIGINVRKNLKHTINASMPLVGIDNNNNFYLANNNNGSLEEYRDTSHDFSPVRIFPSFFNFMIMSNPVFTKNNAVWVTTNENSVAKFGSRGFGVKENYKIPFTLTFGAIAIGKRGNIWISTDNNTIIKLNPANGKIIDLYNFFTDASPKSTLAIRSIALKIGKRGNIWIYNPRQTITTTTENIGSSNVVSNVRNTQKITGGNLLIKMSSSGKIIKKYRIKANNANSIMAIGKRGNIWLAIGDDKIIKIINRCSIDKYKSCR